MTAKLTVMSLAQLVPDATAIRLGAMNCQKLHENIKTSWKEMGLSEDHPKFARHVVEALFGQKCVIALSGQAIGGASELPPKPAMIITPDDVGIAAEHINLDLRMHNTGYTSFKEFKRIMEKKLKKNPVNEHENLRELIAIKDKYQKMMKRQKDSQKGISEEFDREYYNAIKRLRQRVLDDKAKVMAEDDELLAHGGDGMIVNPESGQKFPATRSMTPASEAGGTRIGNFSKWARGLGRARAVVRGPKGSIFPRFGLRNRPRIRLARQWRRRRPAAEPSPTSLSTSPSRMPTDSIEVNSLGNSSERGTTQAARVPGAMIPLTDNVMQEIDLITVDSPKDIAAIAAKVQSWLSSRSDLTNEQYAMALKDNMMAVVNRKENFSPTFLATYEQSNAESEDLYGLLHKLYETKSASNFVDLTQELMHSVAFSEDDTASSLEEEKKKAEKKERADFLALGGYEAVDVAHDGSCLFHSVYKNIDEIYPDFQIDGRRFQDVIDEQVIDEQADVQEGTKDGFKLRTWFYGKMIDELENMSDDDKAFLLDEAGNPMDEIYFREMQTNTGKFGNQIDIKYLAKFLKVRITLFDFHRYNFNVATFKQGHRNTEPNNDEKGNIASNVMKSYDPTDGVSNATPNLRLVRFSSEHYNWFRQTQGQRVQ